MIVSNGEPLSEWLLARHEASADELGLDFSVIAKPIGLENQPGDADRLGVWGTPREAIEHARSADRSTAQVMVNGSGPYWRASEPSVIYSSVFDTVCRDLRLGPELAGLAHEIDDLREERDRVVAELALSEAVGIVEGCADEQEALLRLVDSELDLSAGQARHLLTNLRMGSLTAAGRSRLADRLSTLEARISEGEAR